MTQFYSRPVIPLLMALICGIALGSKYPGYCLWAGGVILLCAGWLLFLVVRNQSAKTLPLLLFDCHSTKYLYKTAVKMDWSRFLTTQNTFAITATTANSNIRHSQYAGLTLKDAIADHFRDKYNSRPSVDTKKPDLWLNLRIDRNKATISLDTSGGSLHRRGYRKETVEAPKPAPRPVSKPGPRARTRPKRKAPQV